MAREALAVLTALVLGFAGCATAPGPKAPDETRRTPVNKVVPPELAGTGSR